jgi:hypothetical protein
MAAATTPNRRQREIGEKYGIAEKTITDGTALRASCRAALTAVVVFATGGFDTTPISRLRCRFAIPAGSGWPPDAPLGLLL